MAAQLWGTKLILRERTLGICTHLLLLAGVAMREASACLCLHGGVLCKVPSGPLKDSPLPPHTGGPSELRPSL